MTKAGTAERESIIEWYLLHHEVTSFKRIYGRKEKYRVDNDGKRYCFIVGIGLWHGLDKCLFDDKASWSDGLLIIGICDKKKITIYEGIIGPLLDCEQIEGSCKINVIERGDYLLVKELPGYHMDKKGTIPIG